LPGFGAANFAQIAPHVTALPADVEMNPCTASGMLLDLNNDDPSASTQWETAPLEINRKKGCWPDKPTLQAGFADPARWAAAQDHYTEKSDWFRLRTHIRVGTAEFVLYSVLLRERSNRVRVFQRSFGSE
jgi:type II secretory pathway component PulK